MDLSEKVELESSPFLEEVDKRIQHLRTVKQIVDFKLDKLISIRVSYVTGKLTIPEISEVVKSEP